MSNKDMHPFLIPDRPHLAYTSLLEPVNVLGKDMTSEFDRLLSRDEYDYKLCASYARLWEDVLETHRSPTLLLRVADMRMALGSSVTALTLYDELQNILNDVDVGRWISKCRLTVEEQTNEMLREYTGDRVGWFTPSQRWIPTALDPFPYCKVQAKNIQDLLTRWKKLQSSGKFSSEFLNMHCLETNYIEGTFFLNEFDTDTLAKVGFDDKTIISKLQQPIGGAVRDLSHVLYILRDTREALSDIYIFRDSSHQLTAKLLCLWHAKLMKSSRVLYNETHPTNKRLVYTNIGITRQTSRVNVTASSTTSGQTIRVQFCPYDQVTDQLELFCQKFNEIIRDDSMDPFACAAWISHTFLTIHPFEDGNGRLSRILSSIPLVRKDLPPLYVMKMFKEAYLLHLNRTRSTPRLGDYQGLMRVLQNSTEAGVNILMLDYNSELRRKALQS